MCLAIRFLDYIHTMLYIFKTFTIFKNSVVQTQVLPTTNVRLLKLVMSLKKAISSLTDLLWKMEKWRLDKTQSLPT